MYRCLLPALVFFALPACSTRGTVSVGGACAMDESCVTGVCHTETRSNPRGRAWIGGYCSGNCAALACSEGLCAQLADGKSYCLSKCAAAGDCRANYVCATSVGACLPDCRLGWSCGPVLQCDSATGTCLLPAGETPRSIGAACELNVQCSSRLCTPEVMRSGPTGWKGGYCTQRCEDTTCADGATCLQFDEGTAWCVATCGSGSACREGYVCTRDENACLPDCRRGWSCGAHLICDPQTGACEVPGVDGGVRPDGGTPDSGSRADAADALAPADKPAPADTLVPPDARDSAQPSDRGGSGGGGPP